MRFRLAPRNLATQARVLLLFALIFSAVSLFRQTPNADLLILNAHVVTMNEKQPSAQAIAIRDGRIVWVPSAKVVC